MSDEAIDWLSETRGMLIDCAKALLATGDAPKVALGLSAQSLISRLDDWQRAEVKCEIQSPGPATGQLPLMVVGAATLTVAGPGAEAEAMRQVAEAWNEVALLCRLPRLSRLDGARASALRARLHEYGLPAVLSAIRRIPTSAFLSGKKGNWRANFDFLIRPRSVAKILEGNYDDTMRRTEAEFFAETKEIVDD